MTRHSVVLGSVMVAATLVAVAAPCSAAVSISGTVTDKEGHYEIGNVPPGSYTVAVWHLKAKAQPKPVTVDAAKPATVDFTLAR